MILVGEECKLEITNHWQLTTKLCYIRLEIKTCTKPQRCMRACLSCDVLDRILIVLINYSPSHVEVCQVSANEGCRPYSSYVLVRSHCQFTQLLIKHQPTDKNSLISSTHIQYKLVANQPLFTEIADALLTKLMSPKVLMQSS